MNFAKYSAAAVAATALFAIGAQAHATVLVDTGAPTGGVGGDSLYTNAPNDYQWLANRFTVGAADTITDISGFIGGNAGTFTIVLYDNTGGLPGAELHSAQATYDGHESFEGLSGLNWSVAAADYWVAFEVRAGDTLGGFMSTLNTPNPQPVGAFEYGAFGPQYNLSGVPIGVRIDGSGVAGGTGGVPEPASWALMIGGFGLAGAALRRRRLALAA
jgi:hypothetical protein